MDAKQNPGVVKSSLKAALSGLGKVWARIAVKGKVGGAVAMSPDLAADDLSVLRQQIQDCLTASGGDVSARARTAVLGQEYMGLSAEGRLRFLTLLATDFSGDPERINAAFAKVSAAGEDMQARSEAERALRAALETPRTRLLTQFNTLPDGVKFLVDMRAEVSALIKADHPELIPLEADIKALLLGWFDVGFLELRRITWSSPAAVLEKIIAYEAVHTIQSWDDLKNRLDADRRLFAFFHPRMPEEPLIFVEVALVHGLAGNVQAILDLSAPLGDAETADTAIFYSINNAQRGLDGISFGNFLIKRVVQELSKELKNITVFSTLSPIPGLRRWLDKNPDLLDLRLQAMLKKPWWKHKAAAEALREPLLRLTARYLVEEKRKGSQRALDPVAHFHLSNGALLERINWLGDTSPHGMKQAWGMMVNYLYRLTDIETNHETYVAHGKVTTSSEVKALLKNGG